MDILRDHFGSNASQALPSFPSSLACVFRLLSPSRVRHKALYLPGCVSLTLDGGLFQDGTQEVDNASFKISVQCEVCSLLVAPFIRKT